MGKKTFEVSTCFRGHRAVSSSGGRPTGRASGGGAKRATVQNMTMKHGTQARKSGEAQRIDRQTQRVQQQPGGVLVADSAADASDVAPW